MSSRLSGCGREVGNGVYEAEILGDFDIALFISRMSLKLNNDARSEFGDVTGSEWCGDYCHDMQLFYFILEMKN